MVFYLFKNQSKSFKIYSHHPKLILQKDVKSSTKNSTPRAQ